MKIIARTFIALSLVIITACILLLLIPPELVKNINIKLGNLYNLLEYLGLLFSSIAILVASIAIEISTSRPKLVLNITPRRGDKDKATLILEKESLKVNRLHSIFLLVFKT